MGRAVLPVWWGADQRLVCWGHAPMSGAAFQAFRWLPIQLALANRQPMARTVPL